MPTTSRVFDVITKLLTLLFFLIFIVFWTGVVYAYGAAWYSLLISAQFFFLARNVIVSEKTLYKRHNHPFWFGYLAIFGFFLTGLAGILVSITPPVNGEDKFLKPLFVFLCAISLVPVIITLRAPNVPREASDSLSSKGIEAESSRCCTPQRQECCRECCFVFFMILIVLAGLSIFVQFSRDATYLRDDLLFAASSLDGSSEQEMNFRCEGTGEPFVLLFHGYGGQALDFEHVLDAISERTTVCSYSRFGYGLSREFSKDKRTSENFALELNEALQELEVDADKFNNVIVAGHSMGGFNMRAYDKVFPGRIAAMVMIDPVDPQLTDDCFEGGNDNNGLVNEAFLRLADSGIFLPLEVLGIQNLVAPIDALPPDVQTQYAANLLRTDFFQTRVEEGQNWGESCEFVADHTATYPVTVFIPEEGIYADRLEDANVIQDFSSNPNSKTVAQVGRGSDHVAALFDIAFVQAVIDEIDNFVSIGQNFTDT